MSLRENKIEFLRYEVGILTIKAALSTRAVDSPIYSAACMQHQRTPFKDALRHELEHIEATYSNGRVAETAHCDYIDSLAERISRSHAVCLHQGRFRFGIAQKLVNLYLKYLWSLGFVEEPPHCPLDGIVRDLANLNYDWITSDSREEYEDAISTLNDLAQPRSLSAWELREFRRREQGNA